MEIQWQFYEANKEITRKVWIKINTIFFDSVDYSDRYLLNIFDIVNNSIFISDRVLKTNREYIDWLRQTKFDKHDYISKGDNSK